MPPPERSTGPRGDGPGSERNLQCPWPPPAFAQVCPLPREQTGTIVRCMHRKQVSFREGSYHGSARRCPPAGGASDPRRIARRNTSLTHGQTRLRRVEPPVCARTLWGDPIRRVADRQTLSNRVVVAELGWQSSPRFSNHPPVHCVRRPAEMELVHSIRQGLRNGSWQIFIEWTTLVPCAERDVVEMRPVSARVAFKSRSDPASRLARWDSRP